MVIVWVRNVYATAVSDLVKGGEVSLLSRVAIWTRIRSSAFACPSEIPASCDLPPAQRGLLKSSTLPTVGRPIPLPSVPWMRLVTTNAYSVASFSGLAVSGFVPAAGWMPIKVETHTPGRLGGCWRKTGNGVAGPGNRSSYVEGSTSTGLFGFDRS